MSDRLKATLLDIAILFMIIYLSHLNSESLIYLTAPDGIIGKIFSVIGAIAFSIVTIRVLQEDSMTWQKVAFPMFDIVLVFLNFNISVYPQFRIYLTIFMSLFAGTILYSLGKIKHKSGEGKGSTELQKETTRANSLGKQLDSLKREMKDTINLGSKNESMLKVRDSEMESLKSQFLSLKNQIKVMRPIYTKAELSRIRKKTEDNRTADECEFLNSNS